MRHPTSSVRITIFLSISLSASAYTFSSFYKPFPSPLPVPKATPSDLLSLLGPESQSSAVNPLVAQDLRSCFKYLVPFKPVKPELVFDEHPHRRSLTGRSRREEDELVWWPPESVLELSRLAVDSGGDPAAIQRALNPDMIPRQNIQMYTFGVHSISLPLLINGDQVPDIEGSDKSRCQLTRTPYGRRFVNEELDSYLEFLFELIVSRATTVGLNISLNRYDFFHGHLFLATDSGRLGILFHAKEYPAYDEDAFPYNTGYCQTGSNVTYDDSMNLRNILWLAPLPSSGSKSWVAPGVVVVLDARPDGIIYRDLIPEYVRIARTLYEDDLGDVVVDVNYLNSGGKTLPLYQIFLC